METERLNDNEVREVARMQRVIDTLESSIITLGQIAMGTTNKVTLLYDTFDGCEEIEYYYQAAYKKLIELQDGKAE